jgi:hypothetical protein
MKFNQLFSDELELPVESLSHLPGLEELTVFHGMEAKVELRDPIEQPYNYGYPIQRYSGMWNLDQVTISKITIRDKIFEPVLQISPKELLPSTLKDFYGFQNPYSSSGEGITTMSCHGVGHAFHLGVNEIQSLSRFPDEVLNEFYSQLKQEDKIRYGDFLALKKGNERRGWPHSVIFMYAIDEVPYVLTREYIENRSGIEFPLFVQRLEGLTSRFNFTNVDAFRINNEN